MEPTLFGEKKVIEQVCAENDIDIKAFNIVDEASDVKCVQQAVAAVVAGNADVLMKGLVSTDKYMRGILNKGSRVVPPKGVLSHVSIVEMPCYHKLLVISDVAVIPLPDFKQKIKQIGYLAKVANLLGIETPKIACIAPPSSCSPASFHRPKAPCWPKWATADSWATSSSTAPVARRSTLQGCRRAQESQRFVRSGRPRLPAFPQPGVSQRLLQVGDAPLRRRTGRHGRRHEGALRTDLARRHEQDQTLLDRTGLPGRKTIGTHLHQPTNY